MPLNALVFALRSKVDLIWVRTIRPFKAQSVQFSKIAKKLNIDLWQFVSHWKEAPFLLKSWNKNGGHRTRFVVELQKVRTKCIYSDFWEGWGEFQNVMYVEGGSALKIPFLTEFISRYHS